MRKLIQIFGKFEVYSSGRLKNMNCVWCTLYEVVSFLNSRVWAYLVQMIDLVLLRVHFNFLTFAHKHNIY